MARLVKNKNKECCGCMLCKNVCPVNAIHVEKNSDGALYPQINETVCISCGKCENICAFHCGQSNSVREAYAARRKDDLLLQKSQSGGTFAVLAEHIWECDGVVYGCAINDDMTIQHIRVENSSDRTKLYGSKYVQSDIDGVYKQLKRDLKAERYVLFCGTSCQIAAIKKFASPYDKNLITVDILCHGVPGREAFDLYLSHLEKKYKGSVQKIKFRDKQVFGWKGAGESIQINGKWIHSDQYMTLYNTGLIFRESCYACPFKCLEHPGDITIGDLWGVEQVLPEFNDNKGVSLVLVNTDKGQKILDRVQNSLNYIKIDVSQCMQEVLKQPANRPSFKNLYWRLQTVFPNITMKAAVLIRKIGYKIHW